MRLTIQKLMTCNYILYFIIQNINKSAQYNMCKNVHRTTQKSVSYTTLGCQLYRIFLPLFFHTRICGIYIPILFVLCYIHDHRGSFDQLLVLDATWISRYPNSHFVCIFWRVFRVYIFPTRIDL